MIYDLTGGARAASFKDARQQASVIGALGYVGGVLGRLAKAGKHGVSMRADGAHIPHRAHSKEWGETWGTVQGMIFEDAAHSTLQEFRPRVRADAFAPGAGAFGAQDLVQNWSKVYTEQVQPIEYPDVFNVQNVIAMGAESYRIKMLHASGMAQKYRMGLPAANIEIGMSEFDRPMHTFASIHYMTYMQGENARFANFDYEGGLLEAARTGHFLTLDELSFDGAAYDCWGLKNYPGLGTYDTGLDLTSVSADQLAQAFIGMMRRPVERSKKIFRPYILDVSPAIFTMAQTLTMGDVNETVADWFSRQKSGDGKTYILREQQRLTDIGGSGVDGCLAHGAGESQFELEITPPLVIPGIVTGWSQETIVLSRSGGMYNPYPVGAELAFIDR